MLTALAWIVVLPPLLALAIYALEVLVGLKGLSQPPGVAGEQAVAVLVPAHDEAEGIAITIAGLRRELGEGGRIVVVADNCSDATAARASAAGAEVVERRDSERRGKGFALAFGRDHLAASPPDVVVVADADCAFVPGGLATLVAAAADGPAQAVYLLDPDRKAPPLVQISGFAFLVKNLVRARGTSRIAGATLLTGTGMAFPWRIFAGAPLATGDIVEDLGLSLALLRQGVPPRLVNGAQVRSAHAALPDTHTQRRRWEHGFLDTALRQAPRLIAGGAARGSRAELAFGLHLLVPPLALLFFLAAAAAAVATAMAWAGASWSAATALLGGLTLAAGATLLAWASQGRAWLAPSALLRAPLYVLWKIPLYLRFIYARETRWVRTRR